MTAAVFKHGRSYLSRHVPGTRFSKLETRERAVHLGISTRLIAMKLEIFEIGRCRWLASPPKLHFTRSSQSHIA